MIETIRQLGWERPQDTGESSRNCLLAEIRRQVRTGAMALSTALHRFNTIKAPAEYPAVRSRLA